jgi:LytS/YehU family sensor histidine kinase
MDISPETLDASVPNLILQPIVENAIRHGIAPYATAGRVTIEPRRRDGVLELRVRDTGPGLADLPEIGKGIGLANTEARLQRLYGPQFAFELTTGKAGGVSVLLAIPFQTDEQTQDAPAYEPGPGSRGR